MIKRKFIFYLFLFSIFYFLFSIPAIAAPAPQPAKAVNPCEKLNEPEKSKCQECVKVEGKSWTVLGCLSTSPEALVGTGLRYALGLAGALALFLILFAGFQMMTSAGDPEKLSSGRELLVSALIGLLIIIFSVFILQFIGLQILKIPGFPQFGK